MAHHIREKIWLIGQRSSRRRPDGREAALGTKYESPVNGPFISANMSKDNIGSLRKFGYIFTDFRRPGIASARERGEPASS
jgi:hypothetical protein